MTEEFKKAVRYVVWQFEIAPNTNRKHIQAYVETTKTMTLTGLKKLFGCPSMHVEKRRGSPEQAANYCKKAESRDPASEGFHEWGILSRASQGTRNDLANAVEVMKVGGVASVATEMPTVYIRNHRGLHQLEYMLAQTENSEKDRNLTTMVFYGSPGTGKTWMAHNLCRQHNLSYYVLHPPSSRNQSVWFNGYSNQKVLIVDEMNGEWMGWQFLLQLLDKYPLQVQTKGGQVWAGWETVILTSNAHWESWYPYYNGGMDKKALERRLHKIYKFFGDEENGFHQLEIKKDTDPNLDAFPPNTEDADIKQHFILKQPKFKTPTGGQSWAHLRQNNAEAVEAMVMLEEAPSPDISQMSQEELPKTAPTQAYAEEEEEDSTDAILRDLEKAYGRKLDDPINEDADSILATGEKYGSPREESPSGSQASEGEESDNGDGEEEDIQYSDNGSQLF